MSVVYRCEIKQHGRHPTPYCPKCDRKMDQHEDVKELAYEKWERAGRPHGRDREFWLAAEREVKEKKPLWRLWEEAAKRVSGIPH